MYIVVLQVKHLDVKLSRQEIPALIYEFYEKNYRAKTSQLNNINFWNKHRRKASPYISPLIAVY